jgi:hypothetical protein
MTENMNDLHPGEPRLNSQSWVRAASIPTAALGVVAFFLPWLQMSCGPISLSLSGYDMASGKVSEKLDPARMETFSRRVQRQLSAKRPGPRPRTLRQPEHTPDRPGYDPVVTSNLPLLWIIPVACAGIVLLALFGLPRAPTIIVSALASAYLAYFWARIEQAFTDPSNTGGLLDFHLLFGFWAAWLGLIAPMCAALFKTRRDSTAFYPVQPGPTTVSRPGLPNAYEEHRGLVLTHISNLALVDANQSVLPSLASVKASRSVYSYEAPGQPLCPQCDSSPAIFYCCSHRISLCLNCVGSHDMPAEWSYVPSWRAENASAGQPQTPGSTYTYEAPGLPLCPKCRRLPAIFHCRSHSRSLCLNCVGSHDIPAECSYVPRWRAEKSHAANALSGSLPRTDGKRKTGDVFGIS